MEINDLHQQGPDPTPPTALVPSAPICSAVECWARHTVMDGRVVTYATGFEGDGRFPNGKEAIGRFEVSASRNCVIVHRCEVGTERQKDIFLAAMEMAYRMHRELLACDGRPEWDQPNDKSMGPDQR